ncbi:alpha-galactosidase [Enterococcus ureasiticus]|uniref:alpha-galactosidase n=1 Tax=Enterococcus ureasiticus TaxID=903984 RepID=UPI001A8F02BE|nr:alpha-galactosidase [Enterococcus ureasiticus]MBO0474529.1 alpha-galactosidase [Enterococcus ureasiticus]
MTIFFDDSQNIFHLSNNTISYIIGIEKEKYLTHRYFGPYLNSYHQVNQLQHIDRGFATNPISEERTFSLNTLPLETSTQGSLDYRVSNYQFRNSEGFRITDFVYDRFEILQGKSPLKELPSLRGETQQTLEIYLIDPVQSLEMVLRYTIYDDLPVITRNVEYQNNGVQPIYLENAGSMLLDLPRSDFDLLTLNGSHTNEATIHRQPLHPGIQKISSTRGTSSPQHHPFLGLADRYTNEDQGQVYGFHFIYSGNFVAQAEVEQYGNTRIQMGINPETFEWKLIPESSFQTPEVVLNFSEQGFNQLSQTFHKLYQNYLIPEYWQEQERPILLNSWEGNYFDFTEEDLISQAKQSHDLGIELFVLDDGWFGQREDDTTSLGDWVVNKTKLPNGIEHVADILHQQNMKFGLWFEPEMISVKSHLFEVHPEWSLQVPDYPQTQGRQQLVLNLSLPQVQDYLIQVLSNYLSSNKIDYIKWDMNRHLTEVGSFILPNDQQKEVSHRYVLGLYHILSEVTKQFPHVLFENCSSGGGRFDPGMVAYMPQTWTSDNTDALCRTQIQYGYSYLYPPIMMGAHVSDSPNHQVGRNTPLESRFLIAMSGNFGYELAIEKQSPQALAEIKEQITFYKKHRRLLQFGQFYRVKEIDSTYATAWLFKNETEALLVYSNGLTQPAQPVQYVKTNYLDASAHYKDTETGNIYSGSELNHAGILVPRIKGDFQCFYKHWTVLDELTK